MTAKKSVSVTPEPEPQVDIAALVAQQVAAQLADKQGPEIPRIHCTSCWRWAGPGTARPFYDSQGVCSDCQRSGHGPNPDRCVCTRLGFVTGTFTPGAAHELARAAGVPIENLLREELFTQEDLARLWDQTAQGRWRPQTTSEKSKVELVNSANTASSKLKSLKQRLESQRSQIAKLTEQIAQTEQEIVSATSTHKEYLAALGVEEAV